MSKAVLPKTRANCLGLEGEQQMHTSDQGVADCMVLLFEMANSLLHKNHGRERYEEADTKNWVSKVSLDKEPFVLQIDPGVVRLQTSNRLPRAGHVSRGR